MQFRAKQISPPKEWGTFEDLCHALFKRLWRDPLAQKNGRRGQVQHGVDIFGSLDGDCRSHLGVQCKGKDANYGSKAKWSEVLAEIAKAEKFSPALDRWVFATTVPVDASLQQGARELSIERSAKGQFAVDVLGWEEILALMASEPDVIAEFYPEHADHLPQIIEFLRALPKLEAEIANLADRLDTASVQPANLHGSAVWETVTFDGDRGLGPALTGFPLGPSDASACPRLPEVDIVLAQLRVACSARLVGEPGAGKSICSYQVAKTLAAEGFEVRRLVDPQADRIALEDIGVGKRCLHIIDDAHLLKLHILGRLEELSRPDHLVLSTHNAAEGVSHRGAITLDAKRAVKTIAAALRADLPKTLEAVRLADNRVGRRILDEDLSDRLDHAESVANRPWQFCFVLGGGWRRSKQAADSARAAGADLILAAVAMRQLASRDARAVPEEIAVVCQHAGISSAAIDHGLRWLAKHRLIIGATDCRTPHQRFASVVLECVMEGQDAAGRRTVAVMIEGVLSDPQFPYVGLRILMHELRFGTGNYNWKDVLPQAGVDLAVARCWEAEGSDRGFAALALSDLWCFAVGGASAVIGPQTARVASWISKPDDGAYGFGYFLNGLGQEDPALAEMIVAAVDPIAIATACSDAIPDNAYGLASLLRGIARKGNEDFNSKFRTALDREKLRELAKHEAFLDDAYVLATFCASIVWWDGDLALDMAEAYVPTAQRVLFRDPIEGFNQLSRELASTVLHVFDVLHVYVGKRKPNRRQWAIARRMCEKIDPKQVAEHISAVRPRHFQSAAHFLHFLHRITPRKYDAVLRHLNWSTLDFAVGEDWAHMPHDTEVLLASLSLGQKTRHLVQEFIANRAKQIVSFPPRLMLIVPEIGVTHLASGGLLRLAEYDHLSWDFGGIALAIVAKSHPELVEPAVAPFVESIARRLEAYSRDFTGPAEGFVRIVIGLAPITWRGVLVKLGPVAEDDLARCLAGDEDHRRTAAAVVESALALESPAGEMARRLRSRFPKASVAPADAPKFARRRRLSRRRR